MVFVTERINEGVGNEQEVVRTGVDLLTDEERVQDDVHALHDPGKGGLVVECRPLRKLIPEYGRTGFLP